MITLIPIIEIDVVDEIQPTLEGLSRNNKKAMRSAVKSLGWFLQRELKKGVESGSPGGDTFQERIPHEIRRKLQGGSAARKWYGKMRNAIGYQYEDGILRIGWVSKTAAMYGRKQEFGYKTPVTDEIRKKYAEAGVPLSQNTKYLYLPARNVFDPMAGELHPQIAPYVQEKLNEYATQTVEFSKKARRKYKVY